MFLELTTNQTRKGNYPDNQFNIWGYNQTKQTKIKEVISQLNEVTITASQNGKSISERMNFKPENDCYFYWTFTSADEADKLICKFTRRILPLAIVTELQKLGFELIAQSHGSSGVYWILREKWAV